MNQLTDDVKQLRDIGFISIARQYQRMARCLKRLQRFAEERERYSVYVTVVAEEAEKALSRFEK